MRLSSLSFFSPEGSRTNRKPSENENVVPIQEYILLLLLLFNAQNATMYVM
jgi:hypothetical protein